MKHNYEQINNDLTDEQYYYLIENNVKQLSQENIDLIFKEKQDYILNNLEDCLIFSDEYLGRCNSCNSPRLWDSLPGHINFAYCPTCRLYDIAGYKLFKFQYPSNDEEFNNAIKIVAIYSNCRKENGNLVLKENKVSPQNPTGQGI